MRLTLFLLLSLFVSAASAQDWQLKKDRDDIKVWVRTAEDAGNLKESKAHMVTEGRIDDFLDLLLDFDTYVDWTPKARSGRLVEQVDRDTYIFYSVYKAPMVSDRDLVARLDIMERSADGVRVVMEAVPDRLPEEDGLIRMPRYRGEYVVDVLDDGRLDITLQYLADPGGRVPDWMVNSTASDVPFDLFRNLRDAL